MPGRGNNGLNESAKSYISKELCLEGLISRGTLSHTGSSEQNVFRRAEGFCLYHL